jgi:hypothetical protein
VQVSALAVRAHLDDDVATLRHLLDHLHHHLKASAAPVEVLPTRA